MLETEVLLLKKTTTKDLAEKLRSQYIKNPPEGMSDHDIKLMSDNDLLDIKMINKYSIILTADM